MLSNFSNIVSTISGLISVAAFLFARQADIRARRAETIKNLLGEKETVGYAALKILRDGMPRNRKERQDVIWALVQASLLSKF